MLSLFWAIAILFLAFRVDMIAPATVLVVASMLGLSIPTIIAATLALLIFVSVRQLLRKGTLALSYPLMQG